MTKSFFKSIVIAASIGILVLCTSASVAAENNDPCGCNAALAKDIFSMTHNKEKEVAFLNTIDEKTYSEAKSKGGFGVSIPVVDVIVNASANWDDFQNRRRDYLQSISYTSSEKESVDVFISATKDIAYTAWSQCKQSCAMNNFGLSGWKESENKDTIVFTVYFHAPVGVNKVKFSGSVVNGSVAGLGSKLVPPNTTILASAKMSFLIRRKDKNKPVTIFAQADGYGAVTAQSRYTPEYVATLQIQKLPLSIEQKGKITYQFETPDKHNCSANDHFIGTFVLRPGNGRKISNATKPRYIGPPQSVIDAINAMPTSPWNIKEIVLRQWEHVGEFSSLDSWVVTDTAATAVLNTWSRPAKWEMTADEYEEVRKPATTTTTQLFNYNKPFIIAVPGDAAAATLFLDTDEGRTQVEVGKNSVDGLVVCQSQVPDGTGGNTYQYVVKSQPVPTSVNDVIDNLFIPAH